MDPHPHTDARDVVNVKSADYRKKISVRRCVWINMCYRGNKKQ